MSSEGDTSRSFVAHCGVCDHMVTKTGLWDFVRNQCESCTAMQELSRCDQELDLDDNAQPFVTRDSGEREQFDTGAVRDTRRGKGRFDLLPPRPMRRVALLYERGAEKYGDNNWQKGMPIDRFLDSMLRHAFQYLEGDRDEDHLAAVIFNAAGAMEMEERGGDQV